jgi:hypothetical protein
MTTEVLLARIPLFTEFNSGVKIWAIKVTNPDIAFSRKSFATCDITGVRYTAVTYERTNNHKHLRTHIDFIIGDGRAKGRSSHHQLNTAKFHVSVA